MGAPRDAAKAWWEASRTLGFELRDDTSGNTMVRLFDTMWSAVAPHTELSAHNWMVGEVNGAQALVTYYFRDGGSSSDTHHTHAMLRIDPSLFLGFELERRSLFKSGAPRTGVSKFDGDLSVRTFAPEHARAMLWPSAPELDVLCMYAIGAGFDPVIYDSFAAVTVPRFEADPSVLSAMLSRAEGLARVARERRARIPETAAEAVSRALFADFAEHERLAFDPPRRALRGTYRGFDVGVSTLSAPSAIWNEARYTLALDSGMDLSIARETGFTRFANFIGFSDIRTGDDEVDRALRFKGSPESRVQELFARPDARKQARALVERFGRVDVRGRFVIVKTPQVASSEADLRALLDGVRELCVALDGPGPQVPSPYRRGG